ncbi:MAG: hypothetical protein ACI93R_001076 [Flavobacteriales bacterium]|jgi:hypothetical protein
MSFFNRFLPLISTAAAVCILTGCGSSGDDDLDLSASADDLSNAKAYLPEGSYADVLKSCISAQSSGDACNFETLPLIGMDTENPGVDDIMRRLVVSHDWMGQRFEEVLLTMPDEFLGLFRGVSAIVIDDDIRPAYYTVSTAAIYLDANFFWLSEAEATSVNPKEDPRSSFNDPLAFRALSRYVKDNERAYRYLAPDNYQARSLDDIRLLVASLLLHELAHANDFFPPARLNTLSLQDQPWSAASAQRGWWVSTRLTDINALSSDLMSGIAAVMYLGETPSDAQLALTASDIGAAYEPDGAADDYGYSSLREDAAMLFEEATMKYFFDLDRDQAFTAAPGPNNSCSEYLVKWGVRNRFADAHVTARVEFVLSEMLPNVDFSNFFASVPVPKAFVRENDWCESLADFAAGSELQTKSLKDKPYDNASAIELEIAPYR